MLGILIVTHSNFGKELLRSAELIVGRQENIETLGLEHGDSVEELYKKVKDSLKKLDRGEGVLILTDLFGGSPSNVTAAAMKENNIKVESISGVNLPMLIEALDLRNTTDLECIIDKIIQTGIFGIKNIKLELKEKSNSA
ncbi:PTS system fructose subfamily IIA component [Tepidanaerobacter acetatoxydans Re1]|uniref:PTS system fructose subfamily IIA component n=1 Tax=Tepidanaerobacter acetatoxydans (strain DSM 21804 / JCM 16047 / Re1) TaxID=1209989 RepID=F4LWW3_TEPAE|nr:PTS sugar transporter subunit IIA [Tepidanaerobacter acetatoxydans]AEE91835.1 PTS system fructose subfamily IIA component [Tepidanaerobacter acetatoxydans Re1]CCP26631.1 PTS system fructose subfamily IIA component [Tepidanaerobacter acetatoxydans Re1]